MAAAASAAQLLHHRGCHGQGIRIAIEMRSAVAAIEMRSNREGNAFATHILRITIMMLAENHRPPRTSNRQRPAFHQPAINHQAFRQRPTNHQLDSQPAPAYNPESPCMRKSETCCVHLSQELKADREFVLAAVKQDGWALRHASEERRPDDVTIRSGIWRAV